MAMSKAKRPKSESIVYRFCENVNCNYHASCLEGERSELQAGGLCPKCRIGTIQELRLTQAAGTPVGPATAWALPAPPYGGFVLQLGDDDASSTWGGTTNSDPRHQGAHYVAELQRDLLRLAFYGPARGGETIGRFSKTLMAGVLDFKRHLVREFGVGASDNFTAVRDNAQTGDTPDVYFPPQGLASPSEVYGSVTEWVRALGSPGGAAGTLLRSIEIWTSLWEQSKAPEKREIEQDMTMTRAVIVMADYTRKRFLSGMRDAHNRRSALGAALSAQSRARNSSTLSASIVENLQDDATTLLALLNSLGADMPGAIVQTRQTDAGLPLPSPAAAEPQDGPYTLSIPVPAINGENTRYDWARAVHDQSGPLLTAQQSVSRFIDAKVREPSVNGSFAKRLERFEKDIETRDAQGALIEGLLAKLVEDVSSATSAAAALNARPPTGRPRGDLTYSRTNAISHATYWLRTATPAAPPKAAVIAGPLEGLSAKLNTKESSWSGSTIPMPDNWARIVSQARQLRSGMDEFRTEIQKSESSTIMDGYLAMLRDFGRVDAATARYVRRMVTDGRLGERRVFRTPMGDELIPFNLSGDLPSIVSSEASRAGLSGAPARLMRSVFLHETGAAHSQSYGGAPFVKLGIDWDTPGDRSHFVENKTSGRNLSFSRGWGISQTTLFSNRDRPRQAYASAVPDPANPGRFMAGPSRNYLTVSGIPMSDTGDSNPPIPLFIASAAEGARQGAAIYISKFRATQKRRDCTYSSKYDCENCVRNLNPGTIQTGVVKGGMQFFNEADGDFARVVVNGRIASHRFRTVDRLKELIRSGNYSVTGKSLDALDESDTHEFPCSWLTAITLYAGVGEIAWYYALDRIHAIKSSKG